MSAKTGRQAFPFLKWERDEDGNLCPNESEGMTLRDYFAAKAMQATLIHGKTLYEEHDAFFHIENVAKDSYYIADAMLKEREI